jgi:hypothetical protein
MRKTLLLLAFISLLASATLLAQTTVFSDAFTDTNGVDLGAHTPGTGTSWTTFRDTAEGLEIQSNTVRQINNFTGGRYYQTPDHSTGNYSVTMTLVNAIQSGWGSHAGGVFARSSLADGDNILHASAYECYWHEVNSAGGSAGEWRLVEWAGGSEQAPMDTEADSFTTGQSRTVTLTVNGSALNCDITNGATLSLSATDGSISAAGKTGLYITGSLIAGISGDDYSSSTLAGGAAGPRSFLLFGVGGH